MSEGRCVRREEVKDSKCVTSEGRDIPTSVQINNTAIKTLASC